MKWVKVFNFLAMVMAFGIVMLPIFWFRKKNGWDGPETRMGLRFVGLIGLVLIVVMYGLIYELFKMFGVDLIPWEPAK